MQAVIPAQEHAGVLATPSNRKTKNPFTRTKIGKIQNSFIQYLLVELMIEQSKKIRHMHRSSRHREGNVFIMVYVDLGDGVLLLKKG